MSGDCTTIDQLMELFQQSRKRGEWVSLSMESKDGKDSVNFSIRNPAGAPAGSGSRRSWSPSSAPWTGPLRRKTPSQWRRDQKRKHEFIAKKNLTAASLEGRETKTEDMESDTEAKATLAVPEDEIELSDLKNQALEHDLFKVKGEYKNPTFKPFATVEPQKEIKTLWENLKNDNEIKGIEEIGDGSTCFEHIFEFWGTWKIKKPGINKEYLEDSKNWPKGIQIIEVKPA